MCKHKLTLISLNKFTEFVQGTNTNTHRRVTICETFLQEQFIPARRLCVKQSAETVKL